jgi:hypothetical protein
VEGSVVHIAFTSPITAAASVPGVAVGTRKVVLVRALQYPRIQLFPSDSLAELASQLSQRSDSTWGLRSPIHDEAMAGLRMAPMTNKQAAA